MTVQAKLDELITWYDKNKPDAGREIRVQATADTVGKFAKLRPDGSYWYRDRRIVPIKKTRKQINAEEAAAAAELRKRTGT